MLNVFNSNYEEIGSLDKNLVINTQGKIKIRYNRKFIDLLDNNGNLNVKIPKIISLKDSIDDIDSNGFYIVDGNLYIYFDGDIILLSDKDDQGDYIRYETELNLNQKQISIAQKNIGLTFENEYSAKLHVDTGIVFINDKIYYISNGLIREIPFNIPLSDINNSNLGNATKVNSAIVWKDNRWQYVQIVEIESFNELKKTVNLLQSTINNLNQNEDTEEKEDVDLILYSKFYTTSFIEFFINSGGLESIIFSSDQEINEGEIIILNVSGYYCTLKEGTEESPNKQIIPELKNITTVKTYDLTKYSSDTGYDLISLEEQIKEEFLSYSILYDYDAEIAIVSGEIEKIITEHTVFNLVYESGKLFFIDKDNKKIILNACIARDSDTNESFTVVELNSKNFVINNIGKRLYVKVEQDIKEKFKIDYAHSEIAIEENTFEEITPHVILGDLDDKQEYYHSPNISYRTYKEKEFSQGLYSDQAVFSGGEFREPLPKLDKETGEIIEEEIEDLEVLHFPRYSETLNNILCDKHEEVEDEDPFEDVIPTIKWIKKSSLNHPLKDINEAELPKNPDADHSAIVWKDGEWQYTKIPSMDDFYNITSLLEGINKTIEEIINALKECGCLPSDPIYLYREYEECSGVNLYKIKVKQISTNNGITWTDTEETEKELIQEKSEQCGYALKWFAEDYECDSYNKYEHLVEYEWLGIKWNPTGNTKRGELIEENSVDCGYVEERWIVAEDDFICEENDKYQLLRKQLSYDGGNKWITTSETKKGELIEKNSEDCGYESLFTVDWYIIEGEKFYTSKVDNGQIATLPPTNPTRKHYNFLDWDYNNTPITQNTSIYAKWEYVKPELYLIKNDNSTVPYTGGEVTVYYYVNWGTERILNGITVNGTYQNMDVEIGDLKIDIGRIVRVITFKNNYYNTNGKMTIRATFTGEKNDTYTEEIVIYQLARGAIELPDFDLLKFSTTWTNRTTEDMSGNEDWTKVNSSDEDVWRYNKGSGDLDVYTYTLLTNIPITDNTTLDDYGVGFKGEKSINRDVIDHKWTITAKKDVTDLINISGEKITEENITTGLTTYDIYLYLIWSGDNTRSGGEYTILNMKKILNELNIDKQRAIFIYIKVIWALSYNGTGLFNIVYNLYKLDNKDKGLKSDSGEYDFIPEDESVKEVVTNENQLNNLYRSNEGGSYTNLNNYGDPIATLVYDLESKNITFYRGYITEKDLYETPDTAGTFIWNN